MVCIPIAVLPVIFALTLVILLGVDLSQSQQNGCVNITDASLVALNPEGFEGELIYVQLTLETEDSRTEVKVYKQPCDEVSVLSRNLTVRNMQELVSQNFERQRYNYHGDDTPIYGVEGSVLAFTLSANSSNSNPDCLRLTYFNDFNLYRDALNDQNITVKGDIAQSPCFPVNTSDIPAVGTWSYTFENSEYIYVTIEKGGGVVVNGMISGTIIMYEKTPDLVEGCSNLNPLTYESRMCIVDICQKKCITRDPPKQCIFLQSNITDNIRIQYEDESATFTYNSVLYLTGIIFFAILGCILAIVTLVVYLRYKLLCMPYYVQRSNGSSSPLSSSVVIQYKSATIPVMHNVTSFRSPASTDNESIRQEYVSAVESPSECVHNVQSMPVCTQSELTNIIVIPVQESGNSHPKYDGKLTHVAVNDANDYVKVEDFETDESINGIIEPQECFSMENDIKIQVDFPTRNDRSSEYCTSWSDRCKFLLCNI